MLLKHDTPTELATVSAGPGPYGPVFTIKTAAGRWPGCSYGDAIDRLLDVGLAGAEVTDLIDRALDAAIDAARVDPEP